MSTTTMDHVGLLGTRADGTPACPSCGGVECLCRPRFFPGQVLTDEDLNRLQSYIVGKNRLHNRHLHGWGVVCGLEITCDPCSPRLVGVRSGYALAPCGDDIVVCRDEQVDICKLIEACRDDRRPICDDPWHPPVRDCPDVTERWVLAICYDERPSRGITPLTPESDHACCSKCAGGGSKSCGCGGSGGGKSSGGGCGCGGGGGAKYASAAGGYAKPSSGGGCGCTGSRAPTSSATAKAKKAQCEPTMVCEGYRFTAYRAPVVTRDGVAPVFSDSKQGLSAIQLQIAQLQVKWGPMLTRIIACMLHAFELRETPPATNDQGALFAAYIDYLEAVQAFAAAHANHQCLIIQKLNQLAAAARGQVITAAHFAVLDALLVELMMECICSALLPPCPEPAPMNCVPLGVVTVKRGAGCQVVEICNWEERKFSVNMPTLQYWIPPALFQGLRTMIQRLCCKPNRDLDVATLVGASLKAVRMQKVTNAPASAVPGGAAMPDMAAPPAVAMPMMMMAAAPGAGAGAPPAGAAAPPAAAAAPGAAAPAEAFDLQKVIERLFAGDDATYARLLETSTVGPLAAFAHVANAPDGIRGLFEPVLALSAGAALGRTRNDGRGDQPDRSAGGVTAAPPAASDLAQLHTMVGELAKKVSAQDKTIKDLKAKLTRRDR